MLQLTISRSVLRFTHNFDIIKSMYRLTAGAVVVNNGRILMGLRAGPTITSGHWNMPQGGIEEGEDPFEAAVRELEEETGITDVRWAGETDWYVCLLPKNTEKSKRYKNLIGQKHKWFLCFCNSEPKIKLCKYEYVKSEWVEPEEVLKRIEGSFKEGLYRYIFSKFDRYI